MMCFSHLAFAIAVRRITFPREDKTPGATSPKSSNFISFDLLVLFYFICLPLAFVGSMMMMKVRIVIAWVRNSLPVHTGCTQQ